MFGFGFKFLDPGPLVDGELTLVPPAQRFVDELVHAEAASDAPDLATLRERTYEFLRACPGGHQKAERFSGVINSKVPAYHFWMRLDPRHPAAEGIPIRIVGGLALRVGQNQELELFSGHVGYHVYAPARGHHYAERAVRLLFPLIRRHRLRPLWITANPDNLASRRTIERLGGTLIDTVSVPRDHPFFARGETQKCRYRFDL